MVSLRKISSSSELNCWCFLAPAHFQTKTKQVQVVKGEQAHLSCSAAGDTPMEIMWKLGNQFIENDNDQRFSIREQPLAEGMVSELGIQRTIRQDTGIFTCVASNAYGSDEMNIHLIVQEIPEPPRNVRVMDQLSRSIGISWNQPYAGNSQINHYIVQYKPGDGRDVFLVANGKLQLFEFQTNGQRSP